MDNDIFYQYESSQYGDGVLLNEYRNEFSLVAARRKDGEVYMEWIFTQKRDGSKEPIGKSLPWKIKLGNKREAIKVLKYFLEKLEGGTSPSDHISDDDYSGKNDSFKDDIPF